MLNGLDPNPWPSSFDMTELQTRTRHKGDQSAVDRVLERLQGVRVSGQGWVARCPVPNHGQGRGDRTPSLSVDEGNGKALLCCHAGCSTEDVTDALGLEKADLFDDESAGEGRVRTSASKSITSPTSQEGDDRLQDNTPNQEYYKGDQPPAEQSLIGAAFQVPDIAIPAIREHLNSFKFSEVHRPIVKAILALEAEGQSIHPGLVGEQLEEGGMLEIVGGTHYLYGLAVEASMTPWTPASLDDLARRVQERSERRQLEHIASDMFDLARSGHSLNGDLVDLQQRLQDLTDQSHDGDEPDLVYFEDIPADVPIDWLVEGLMPHPRIIGMGGKRASFKSHIAAHIALCIATGQPVFGQWRVPEPAPVLFLNEDSPDRTVYRQFGYLSAQTGKPPQAHLAITGRTGVNLASAEGVAELRSLIEESSAKLVVLDVLARVWGVDEEWDNAAISRAMQSLRHLAEEENCSFLYLTHLRKATAMGSDAGDLLETFRGGSETVNMTDSAFVVQRDEGQAQATVRHRKNVDAPEVDDFNVTVTIDEETESAAIEWADTAPERASSKTAQCASAILDWFRNEGTSETISKRKILSEALDSKVFSDSTVKRALGKLVSDGLLENPDKGKYRLADSDHQLGVGNAGGSG